MNRPAHFSTGAAALDLVLGGGLVPAGRVNVDPEPFGR